MPNKDLDRTLDFLLDPPEQAHPVHRPARDEQRELTRALQAREGNRRVQAALMGDADATWMRDALVLGAAGVGAGQWLPGEASNSSMQQVMAQPGEGLGELAPAILRRVEGAGARNHEEAARPLMASDTGNDLPSWLKEEMEKGFACDFSDVKVHTGAQAQRASRELGARAFASGKDLFFAPGEWAPSTRAGRALVAHELAHTIQHGEGRVGTGGVSQPGDGLEREADRMADRALGEATVERNEVSAPGPSILREEDDLADHAIYELDDEAVDSVMGDGFCARAQNAITDLDEVVERLESLRTESGLLSSADDDWRIEGAGELADALEERLLDAVELADRLDDEESGPEGSEAELRERAEQTLEHLEKANEVLGARETLWQAARAEGLLSGLARLDAALQQAWSSQLDEEHDALCASIEAAEQQLVALFEQVQVDYARLGVKLLLGKAGEVSTTWKRIETAYGRLTYLYDTAETLTGGETSLGDVVSTVVATVGQVEVKDVLPWVGPQFFSSVKSLLEGVGAIGTVISLAETVETLAAANQARLRLAELQALAVLWMESWTPAEASLELLGAQFVKLGAAGERLQAAVDTAASRIDELEAGDDDIYAIP